jgi:hypothetical protein
LSADPTLDLSLTLNADWGGIEHVRDAAGAAVMALYDDRSLREGVSMVSGELLENAVKYGSWREDDPRIRYRLTGSEREIVVSVQSAARRDEAESRRHLDRLEETLRWLGSYEDPAEAYRERLEAYYDNPEGERPALGMARMASETGCRLTCAETADGFLVVEAHFPR